MEAERDQLIEGLVRLAESFEEGEPKTGVEIQITLATGGFLVSGIIISKSAFMKTNPITEPFDRIEKEEISKLPPSEVKQDDGIRRFIHLKDAKYFIPGQKPIPTTGPGIFWRGRISAVNGFNFGVLREGEPPAS